MSEEGRFTLHLEQLEGYEFKVRFDWDQVPELIVDEPPPLGGRAGPNPSRLLAVAAANCLSASLLFCVTKNEPPAGAVKTAVTCRMVRNDKQRLRVGGLAVRIEVNETLADAARFKRCLTLFEDFCVVTASIRDGIPVAVEVCDPAGNVLHSSG
jgi:organic hydroperoxide reductase OsmC/OhrA